MKTDVTSSSKTGLLSKPDITKPFVASSSAKSSLKKSPTNTYRTLAIKHSTHKGLKSLSMDLSLPMAATVALLLKGWGSVPEDVRRDLLGLPPLLDGPSGEKLGSWLTEQLQAP